MAILQGIKLKNDETVHQLDWEKGIANKPEFKNPIQSDYSQNDETALDFIKNRPFHDNVDGRETVVKETQLPLEVDVDGRYNLTYTRENPLGLSFVEGEKLIYIWNGVEYECTTRKIIADEKECCYKIGNESLNSAEGEDTGEPFFIGNIVIDGNEFIQFNTMDDSAKLEVQRAIKTIKYLDPKFIKDMYGEVNKIEEILPLQPLELSLEGQEEYGAYIPITIDYEIKIGDYMQVMYGGVEYNCKVFDFSQIIGVGVEVPVIGNALGESTEPFYMLFDTTGELSGEGQVIVIMDTTPPQEGVDTITREVGIKYNAHKINYINSKYIKDMYGNFGHELVEVLGEQEFTFTPDTSGVYSCVSQTRPYMLEEGKTYQVTWDGVAYDCVASKQNLGGMEGIAIGNLALIGLEGTSNEPFAIGCGINVEVTSCVANDTKDSHKLSIMAYEEIIHQVPSKYVNAYTKEEIDTMFGAYVDEVDTLLGGE